MNILGTSQNDIDHDFNFFFVDKHNMIAAFQWLCNFFLKKKEERKNILKKEK